MGNITYVCCSLIQQKVSERHSFNFNRQTETGEDGHHVKHLFHWEESDWSHTDPAATCLSNTFTACHYNGYAIVVTSSCFLGQFLVICYLTDVELFFPITLILSRTCEVEYLIPTDICNIQYHLPTHYRLKAFMDLKYKAFSF